MPRKSARYQHFLDPYPRRNSPSPPLPAASRKPQARRARPGNRVHLTPYGLRLTTCDQGWRMFHGTQPGWIEVISGVMFAGKSEELIRRVRRAVIARKQVQVFKSHLDARYAGLYSVTSHDGLTVDAEPVDSADQIMRQVRPDTEVVAIDEAQFLDGGVVTVANALADREIGRASCRERV